MNKKLVVLVAAIYILGVIAIIAYKLILPSYLAGFVTENDLPFYIPEKYKIQIERIQKPIARYSEEAFKVTDSLNLSLDLVLKIIDEVDPDEIMEVYQNLENKIVVDNSHVFALIRQTVKIDAVDINLYKDVFIKNATAPRINRALRYAEKYKLASSLAPATAKKIVRQLAIKHYNLGIVKTE